MGSFNVNCFTTQQVIRPGQKVLLIPIAQEFNYSHLESKSVKYKFRLPVSKAVYPSSRWSVASTPLEATYDDYGRFVLDFKDKQVLDAFQSLYSFLVSCSIPIKKGENPYHEHAFDFEDFENKHKLLIQQEVKLAGVPTPFKLSPKLNNENVSPEEFVEKQIKVFSEFWDLLQTGLHQQRVAITSMGEISPFSFAVVSKNAVDSSAEILDDLKDYYSPLEKSVRRSEVNALNGFDFKVKFYSVVISSLDELYLLLSGKEVPSVQSIEQFKSDLLGKLKELFTENPFDAYRLDWVSLKCLDFQVELITTKNAVKSFKFLAQEILSEVSRACSLFEVSDKTKFLSLKRDFVQACERYCSSQGEQKVLHLQELMALLQTAVKLNLFFNAVYFCNVPIAPVSFASQDYSNEAGKAYEKWVISTNKKYRKMKD